MASTKLLECGRVLVANDCRVYALDCLHCKAVFTQWEVFLGHVKECRKFMRKQGEVLAARRKMETEVDEEVGGADTKTEEGPADEKEVEVEQLWVIAAADDLKQQVEQLYLRNMNNNGFDNERAQEIVATWPIELPSHEDAESCASDNDDSSSVVDDDEDDNDDDDEDDNDEDANDDDDVEDNDAVANYNDELGVGDEMNDKSVNNDDKSDDNADMNKSSFVKSQRLNQQEIDVDDKKNDEFLQTAKEKFNKPEKPKCEDVPTDTATSSGEKQTLFLNFVLSPATVLREFIAQVKEHPCLWKGKTTAYRNRKPRNEALQHISDALNITNDSAAKNLRYLLRWYTQQHNKRSVNSAADDDNADPFAEYYKMCEFLSERMPEVVADCAKHRQRKLKENQAICPYCGKSVSSRAVFGHIQRHTKSLTFKCEVCGKMKQSADELRTHMRVHTGEKPYVCSTCGKKYKTSSALCGHKHRHEKPAFQCPQCPKAYHKRYLLKTHMNVHLNRRPFQCTFCLKSFTSKRYLYMHTKPVLRCAKGTANPTHSN